MQLGTNSVDSFKLGSTAVDRVYLGSTLAWELDTGRTAVTITAEGNAQISTAQSKFGGASALFDGTGDRVYGATDYDYVNNSWTFEAWVYPTDSTNKHIMSLSNLAENDLPGLSVYQVTTTLLVYSGNTTGGWRWNTGNLTGALTVNGWQHIAVVKDGSVWRVYVNGIQLYSGTPGGTMNPPDTISFGGMYNGVAAAWQDWPGYIDEARVSKSVRYTSNFTPATTPFVNDADTLLLLHMDGTNGSTVFFDDIGPREAVNITAVGNTQIDTAEAKFGSSSVYFDNNDDVLQIGSNGEFDLGSDNFTIEGWVKLDGTNPDFDHFFGIWSNTNSLRTIFVGMDSSNKPVVYYVNSAGTINTNIIGSTSLTTGSWYHIAVVGDSTNIRLYVNGQSQGTPQARETLQYASSNSFALGGDYNGGASPTNEFNGWIDEFRISSVARYTSNFTPPASAFTNDAATLVLVHMEGADGSTTFTDDNS